MEARNNALVSCGTCGSTDGVPRWITHIDNVLIRYWHTKDAPWNWDISEAGNRHSCQEQNCQPCPTCSAKKEVSAMTEHVFGDLAVTVENLQRIVEEKKAPVPHKIWLVLYDGNGHFGPHEVECPCPLHREQGSDETSQGEQSSGDKGTRNQAASSASSLFADVARELAANIGSGEQGVRTMTGILSRRFGLFLDAIAHAKDMDQILRMHPNYNLFDSTKRFNKALTDLEKKK